MMAVAPSSGLEIIALFKQVGEPFYPVWRAAESGVTIVVCPYCQHDIPPNWKQFMWTSARDQLHARASSLIDEERNQALFVEVFWMACPNEKCRQLLVKVRRGLFMLSSEESGDYAVETWFAVPQKSAIRRIDPLIQDPFRRDYLEAAAILTDSPRMSAALARKILADLLETHGGVKRSLKLSKMIDEFVAQPGHPSHVVDNLHYLREIADFGVHTQKDELGNIVDVEPHEAEWTLEVVDTLFDYFIVAPEKDRLRRVDFDKKIAQAGRKPIRKNNDGKIGGDDV